jgi:hypothetical protein
MQPCDCVRGLQRGQAFQTLKPEPLTRGAPLGTNTHLQHSKLPRRIALKHACQGHL